MPDPFYTEITPSGIPIRNPKHRVIPHRLMRQAMFEPYRKALSEPGWYFPYIRVSDIKQTTSGCGLESDDGLGLAYQRKRLTQLFEDVLKPIGVQWDGDFFADKATSALDTPFKLRPAGSIVYNSVRPGDRVAVIRFDRLCRLNSDGVELMAYFESNGVIVHTPDDPCDLAHMMASGMGQQFVTWLAMFAQMEVRKLSERVCAVNEIRRQNGLPTNGRAMWGFKIVGESPKKRFEPNPEERAVMDRIVTLFRKHNKTAAQIAEILTRENAAPWRGKDGQHEWSERKVLYVYEAEIALRFHEGKEDSIDAARQKCQRARDRKRARSNELTSRETRIITSLLRTRNKRKSCLELNISKNNLNDALKSIKAKLIREKLGLSPDDPIPPDHGLHFTIEYDRFSVSENPATSPIVSSDFQARREAAKKRSEAIKKFDQDRKRLLANADQTTLHPENPAILSHDTGTTQNKETT